MTAVVVADTGPLIALAKTDRLELLRDLYAEVAIPEAVHRELDIGALRPGATRLEQAIQAGWLRCVPLGAPDCERAASLGLDPGESEALLLAEASRCRFLLIDDRQGRRAAHARGIPVTGVAGVLLVAKEKGLVREVAVLLQALEGAGYRLEPALVARVLEQAHEEVP